jgi:hypothetical protein
MVARRWLAVRCQCRQPPKAVAEGQHLQGAASQQSLSEIGG